MNARERAVGLLRERASAELVERLEHLDAAIDATKTPRTIARPDRGTRPDVDVLIAGGGLSLLLAPILAASGLRVAVADRARVGLAHREWNAGTAELGALVASGILTREELERVVVARYDHGVCAWHRGGRYPVTGALDHAIDAGALLAIARERAVGAGVELLDHHAVVAHAAGDDAIAIGLETPGKMRVITARVLVDARGASSPFASADLVCPTVGGVLRGLEEATDDPSRVDPRVGEILATTEDVDDGRQHLWETFPGRGGETTIYLFYYARSRDRRPGALLDLYARFFDRLGGYKRGDAKLARPTFGFIPGWSRLGPAPSSPSPRIVLVGDAAARHSPLTFCGFGATVRGLSDSVRRVMAASRGWRGREMEDAAIHAGTGALSLLLASPPAAARDAGLLNDLLDAAFSTLHELGDATYGALLRDEMTAADFVRFLRRTAAKRPRVYRDVMKALAPSELLRWSLRIAREVAVA